MAVTEFNIQGNAWNNVATGASGLSNTIDLHGRYQIALIGSVNGATTLTIEATLDQINWYATNERIFLVGSGDFHKTFVLPVPFLRIRSSLNITATVSVCATG